MSMLITCVLIFDFLKGPKVSLLLCLCSNMQSFFVHVICFITIQLHVCVPYMSRCMHIFIFYILSVYSYSIDLFMCRFWSVKGVYSWNLLITILLCCFLDILFIYLFILIFSKSKLTLVCYPIHELRIYIAIN